MRLFLFRAVFFLSRHNVFLGVVSKNDQQKQMTAASSDTGKQTLSSSKKKDDDALLTIIERKSREYGMIRVPGRDPNSVMAALETIRSQYHEH